MSLFLKDVAEFVTSRIEISEIDETNYISTENMIQNRGGVSKASSLPKTKSVKSYCPKDILLNNIRPYFKKIWFSDKSGGCSSDIFVIRVNENYNPKFIYYVLSSDNFFTYVMANAKGTKMPRGDKNAIQNYVIPDFTFDEQTKISYILSSLDKKIEINKKINRNLFDIIDIVFTKFVGNYEKLEEVNLSDNTEEIIRGFNSKYVDKSNLINLNQKVNKGIFLEKQYFKYLDENIKVPKEKFAKKRDVLLNSLGQGTLGRPHYFNEDTDNIVVDQHITIIRADENLIPSTYIYEYLKNSKGQYHLNNLVSGTSGMLMINISDIRSLKIPILSTKKLKEFDSIVTPLFDIITRNIKEIESLTKIRDTLLPQLMSGELDISKINCDLE